MPEINLVNVGLQKLYPVLLAGDSGTRLLPPSRKSYPKQFSKPMLSHVNIGSGDEMSIKELAENMKRIVEFTCKVVFDPDKPDGSPRKKLNSDKLQDFGFSAKIDLNLGLSKAYHDFKVNYLK